MQYHFSTMPMELLRMAGKLHTYLQLEAKHICVSLENFRTTINPRPRKTRKLLVQR
jgi:hypothetical protein